MRNLHALPKRRRTSALITVSLVSAAFVIGTDGIAQTYPAKPIRVIVPFPPGGGADIVMRAISQKTAESLRQPMIVENRAGASGLIGAELAARLPPDGYSIVLATSSNFSINPHLVAKRAYEPLSDFSPLALLATAPLMIAVHPSLPVRSVNELVALARARRGELLYGSNGAGSLSHLTGVLFASTAGIDMRHVPYKGGTPAVTDAVAGHVSLIITAIPTLQAQIRSQRLRAIALTGRARSPLAPELQTVSEAGLKGFESVQWYGLFGPRGMNRDVVEKLQSEVTKALRATDVLEVLARDGAEPRGDGPDALAAFVRADYSKWEKVIRQNDIKATEGR